jgi:UDP-N-acetylmuramoyl-tripeptide--D-alanyl-D-alanine ligase
MKKALITLEDLFNLPSAEIFNPDDYKPASGVSIDSRKIPADSLFIAIAGERLDGHNYVNDAVAAGVKGVIINKSKLKKFKDLDIPFVAVDDTTKALGDLSNIWRNKLSVKIIAITGSAGKTSTKEMMSVLLNEKYSVNKTIANNNNHIGVPLTLLSSNNKHDVVVLELGTNHFGEIEYTANLAEPDYALITNIGSSHLEFLRNKHGVFKEKIALFNATEKNKGLLFINIDDPLLKKYSGNYKQKVTYGFSGRADVKGKIRGLTPEGKHKIEISYTNKKLEMDFPLYGEQSIQNFLACAAVAFNLGITKSQIVSGVKKLLPVDKRLNLRENKNFILIDDTYNANPDSMKYAIQLLGKISKYNRKIAILGDMFELGAEAPKHHKNLASALKKNKVDEVYTLGGLMRHLFDALPTVKMSRRHFIDRKELKVYLKEKDLKESVILVKGSRGMKMEEFVNIIESK